MQTVRCNGATEHTEDSRSMELNREFAAADDVELPGTCHIDVAVCLVSELLNSLAG